MSVNLILDNNNVPYFDLSIANKVAFALTKEIGYEYIATEYQDGYAVLKTNNSQNTFNELYLRPVLRSQMLNIGMLIICLSFIVFAEPILQAVGIKTLQLLLYDLFSKTIDWVLIVNIFRIIILTFSFVWGISILLHLYNKTYFIGPKGIEYTTGILSRENDRVEFKQVSKVKARQSFFQRVFRYGTIEIYTSASDGAEFSFDYISNPVFIESEIKRRMKAI